MAENLAWRQLKHSVIEQLFDSCKSNVLEYEQPGSTGDRRSKQILSKTLASLLRSLPIKESDIGLMTQEVLGQIETFGPLADLVLNPHISQIQVNGRNRVFVEKDGKLLLTDRQFQSERHLTVIIQRILYPTGQLMGPNEPVRTGRIDDETLVTAMLPPLAPNGGALVIRKISHELCDLGALLDKHALSVPMARFLESCVRGRRNIVVIGPSGSGKTTLLAALAKLVPQHERLICIERQRELSLTRHINHLSLEYGSETGTLLRLLDSAVEMRPNRLILGECRGAEVVHLLQAMTGSFKGSMTTVNANTSAQLVSKLESFMLLGGENVSDTVLRSEISAAVDLVVQLGFDLGGGRRILRVTEMAGLEGDIVAQADIFLYEAGRRDGEGRFLFTGRMPSFTKELGAMGITLERRSMEES